MQSCDQVAMFVDGIEPSTAIVNRPENESCTAMHPLRRTQVV